ncbi:MAG TPA: DUF6734 family protein [Candidatus Angelobacter sp.]
MRAVWSFWSRPYETQKGRPWRKPLHFFLAWGLSLSLARRHCPDTVLVTDESGKQLLIDALGLQFASVSTELECLHQCDPEWWALGKLIAYSIQNGPFVHLDNDVFLWKPLPQELLQAPVFAQCPEYFLRNSDRSSRDIEAAFAASKSTLPVEWEWAASRNDFFFREENCGIVGGCRVDFLRHYAQTAAHLVMQPQYAPAWSHLPAKSNMAVEQFFLSACLDFHRHHPRSPFRGVHIHYLFRSWDDAVNPNCATRAGFTHLLGDSKCDPAVGRRLEERVKRDDPGFFRHCERVAERMR